LGRKKERWRKKKSPLGVEGAHKLKKWGWTLEKQRGIRSLGGEQLVTGRGETKNPRGSGEKTGLARREECKKKEVKRFKKKGLKQGTARGR